MLTSSSSVIPTPLAHADKQGEGLPWGRLHKFSYCIRLCYRQVAPRFSSIVKIGCWPDASRISQSVIQPADDVDFGRTQSGLSARHPLLGLPLTQNHRCLRRQWCDERRMWVAEWNKVIFTDESRICLQHHYGRIRVWRHHGERMLNSTVMHRHSFCTGYYGMRWYWISLSHSCSTHCRYFKEPALHLRGVGASCLSLPSWHGHSHISTG
ncbi:transposable element Tcb1 transposase [Trichonephila clavipes]|nr:transposable element Tcb1 transposase [Trichonephila clavipes]